MKAQIGVITYSSLVGVAEVAASGEEGEEGEEEVTAWESVATRR